MFHGTCESEASTVFVFVLSIVHSDCDCCFLFSAFVAGVVVTVYCSSVFGCNLFVEDYFISNLCKRNHFDVCTMHTEKFTSYQKHSAKRTWFASHFVQNINTFANADES